MNNQVLASVADKKMQIPLSCAVTDVTQEAFKNIDTDYTNGSGHAIPGTPLARVVSTCIAKVVITLPLRDLYLHDGHFQSVISASFATKHGIDLRRAYGVFQHPVTGSYHGAYGHLQHPGEGKKTEE